MPPTLQVSVADISCNRLYNRCVGLKIDESRLIHAFKSDFILVYCFNAHHNCSSLPGNGTSFTHGLFWSADAWVGGEAATCRTSTRSTCARAAPWRWPPSTAGKYRYLFFTFYFSQLTSRTGLRGSRLRPWSSTFSVTSVHLSGSLLWAISCSRPSPRKKTARKNLKRRKRAISHYYMVQSKRLGLKTESIE